MALLYQAELRPSKIDLVSARALGQTWFRGDPDSVFEAVAAYRFDDPNGQVGIETHLVRAGDGPVLQVPTTYRGAPLEGAEALLIGTMQHSVLGKRWVYDAVGDPVYLAAVATAVLTGAREADLFVDVAGKQVQRESSARVEGSGASGALVPSFPALDAITVTDVSGSTVMSFDGLRVEVVRALHPAAANAANAAGDDDAGSFNDGNVRTLTGTWAGQVDPRVLVVISAV